MIGIEGVVSALLSQSEKRLEIAAENIASLTTPGYRRKIAFSTMVPDPAGPGSAMAATSTVVDLGAGKVQPTGNPADLAIIGKGYFIVRGGDQLAYTRAGQFSRTSDGRLTTPEGLALQAADGGDLVLQEGDFAVAADGIVTQKGAPVARLAVVDVPAGTALEERGALLTGPGPGNIQNSSASIRQGAIEMSNVSMGDEMVTMMEALRRAESAQRLMNVYDDLMGRILTSTGQG